MSYNEQLQTSNELLQSILESVNKLPDAGSSDVGTIGTRLTSWTRFRDNVQMTTAEESDYADAADYFYDYGRYVSIPLGIDAKHIRIVQQGRFGKTDLVSESVLFDVLDIILEDDGSTTVNALCKTYEKTGYRWLPVIDYNTHDDYVFHYEYNSGSPTGAGMHLFVPLGTSTGSTVTYSETGDYYAGYFKIENQTLSFIVTGTSAQYTKIDIRWCVLNA